MSEAFKSMEAAFTAKRKEMYGAIWDKVDFYGIPNRDLPQEEREAILAAQRAERQRRATFNGGLPS
jgi:hypothetical protein